MKLGSLFDGSGGFPLGAVLNGIAPMWASEIEPFPIRVTTRRFPNMKHYGNVAEIDGGKSACNVAENLSPTLTCTHGGEPCVAYGIDRAAFNQGVNAKYDFSIEEELMPTMVAKGANACAYGFYPQMKAESIAFAEEKSNCIVNGTNPGYQNGVVDNHYIVRRLTPTECARLQGFPDWWCDGLESENPSEEEISWWANVFEMHRKAVGESTKPKTRNQIVRWLKNPHSDTAEYKMWGQWCCPSMR